jgi:nitrate/nitrite transport system ATP-binding protein
MPYLAVHRLEKSFVTPRGTTHVLGGVDLALEESEFVAVVGYSGSGKTTLVSLIGGLLTPDAGSIVLDGVPVAGPGPERGIVFQQYSLLPWMSVYDNVALAVDAVNGALPAPERRRIAEEFIALVNLTPAMWKRPRELSGGMRQRVAVARGLAMQPKVLLMDEPFSALDALTRATLQDELLRIWGKRRSTVVLVTNDVDEAILLGDRIIPLSAGPAATLGPEFPISIARPRERLALNHNTEFRHVRTAVVEYLLSTKRQPPVGRAKDPRSISVPTLEPST